jgi:hypothetical protein
MFWILFDVILSILHWVVGYLALALHESRTTHEWRLLLAAPEPFLISFTILILTAKQLFEVKNIDYTARSFQYTFGFLIFCSIVTGVAFAISVFVLKPIATNQEYSPETFTDIGVAFTIFTIILCVIIQLSIGIFKVRNE